MKRKWLVILVALLLVGAIIGARLTRAFARNLVQEQVQTAEHLEELRVRTLNADAEKKEYTALAEMAENLVKTIRLEPDSTNLLRWFNDTTRGLNLQLRKSARERTDHDLNNSVVLDEAVFETITYVLHVEGTYSALVQCVERLERSPHVMLIEGFSLETNSEDDGTGQLKASVVCLFPKRETTIAGLETSSEE